MTHIDVDIDDPAWLDASPDVAGVVRKVAEAALYGRASGGVAALLTGDAEVRSLNRRFRAMDRSTNVLSFPAPESARPHLGDIVIAYGVCSEEAKEQGKRLDHHLMHLTIHGVLHLLGYDHETDADAVEMESLERAILAELGVADPYAIGGADAPL